jgi:hypothetical protein
VQSPFSAASPVLGGVTMGKRQERLAPPQFMELSIHGPSARILSPGHFYMTSMEGTMTKLKLTSTVKAAG